MLLDDVTANKRIRVNYGPPCSRARNTDAFQVVVYEAVLLSMCYGAILVFNT